MFSRALPWEAAGVPRLRCCCRYSSPIRAMRWRVQRLQHRAVHEHERELIEEGDPLDGLLVACIRQTETHRKDVVDRTAETRLRSCW